MSAEGVILFWKQPGETLAVLLRRFREERGLSADEKVTYAGRLDPMAEGIVPILVGEARFQKDHLIGKAKTYEVDILLGIGTDTGDMLGVASPRHSFSGGGATEKSDIQKAIIELSHTTELPYPRYSSRPVDGTPLFMHARAGRAVTVPIKKVTIYSMELLGIDALPLSTLLGTAQDIIKKVQGDFRQEAILEQWEKLKKEEGDTAATIVRIRTTVSSGTYMRSLAERMGELLGVPALAYTIKRTAVEE